MRTAGPTAVVAYLVLAVGSVAGLCWLAPLEYSTGRWLGIAPVLAAVVPALIDSYVVLSVMTGRDRRWSLPIAAISGGVGQLHAANVLPEADPAVRAKVATLAVVLAVLVTARLKPLVLAVIAGVHQARHDAAEMAHQRAVELAQMRAADEVRADAERAVTEAREAAEESRRRAVELAEQVTAERSAWAVERAELRATLTARAEAQDGPPPARREPSRRPTRTAKSQVAAEVAEGLTESEVAVLGYMLGRGEVQRQAIVEETGIPLGTVKRAITTLSAKRLIVACAVRGQYRSVDPILGSDEPSEAVAE
jgi:hypothetical protein